MKQYYRIFLHKERDRDLIKWLESDRDIGEQPSRAVRRKLRELFKEHKKGGGR